MTALCIFCSNHNSRSTASELRTHSDVAVQSNVNNVTCSAQKAVGRQSSTLSRKSSSAKSDATSALSQKFAPRTYQHVSQQKNLKVSMNV